MQCVHQKFLFTILFSDKKKTQVFIDEKVGVNAVLNVPPITAQMFFAYFGLKFVRSAPMVFQIGVSQETLNQILY